MPRHRALVKVATAAAPDWRDAVAIGQRTDPAAALQGGENRSQIAAIHRNVTSAAGLSQLSLMGQSPRSPGCQSGAMSLIDQTMHFLRPVKFDVVADARVIRIVSSTSFARVTVQSAVDRRPVGIVSSAYSMQ